MWEVLEHMLLGLSIIFVSVSSEKLVKFIEVFRTLLYPYVYQGLIYPYDPYPSKNLIMSSLPYIIGCNRIETKVPPKTLVVDIDTIKDDENDQEVFFISESEVIFEAQKEGSQLDENSNVIRRVTQRNQDKKPKIPESMLNSRRTEINRALAKIEKADTYERLLKAVNAFETEVQKVTINDLLKCKNGNDFLISLRNEESFMNERAYLIKDPQHKEFFKCFVGSQTFKAFVKTLRDSYIPENIRIFQFVSSYADKRRQTENLAVSIPPNNYFRESKIK